MRTKITLCPTLGYDAKGTEKVLGEMSRKGWILRKAGMLWRYEEAEPKERAFSVVFTRPEDGWMDNGESDELKSIVDYAESLGWQRISSRNDRSNNNISFFMNEDPEAEPLDTDDSVHLMNTKRTIGKTVRGIVLCAMWLGLYSFMNYSVSSRYPYLERPTFLLLMMVIEILMGLTVLVGYLTWSRRANKALAMGEEIPDMLKYTKLFRAVEILLVALSIAVCLSVEGGLQALVIVSICLLGLALAGWILKSEKESDSLKKKAAMIAAALAIAVAAIIPLIYYLSR